MKTVIWIRPSGSEIELADTKNFKKLAKDSGWKKKKAEPEQMINADPQLEMGETND